MLVPPLQMFEVINDNDKITFPSKLNAVSIRFETRWPHRPNLSTLLNYLHKASPNVQHIKILLEPQTRTLHEQELQSLAKFSSLKCLDLSANGRNIQYLFEDPPVQGVLSPKLGRLRSIEKLYLDNNDFSVLGASKLKHTLTTLPQLLHLHVAWNQLRLDGAHQLAEGLKSLPLLEKLDVRWNDLREEGCSVLLSSLEKHNSALRFLDMSHNRMGTSGARSLSLALRGSLKSLRSLDVSFNRFDDSSIGALCSGLRYANSLEQLDISGNTITNVGATSIALTIAHLPRLSFLDLGRTLQQNSVVFCPLFSL